ncbi:hypothetical protein LQF12_15315 [Ruania suaedae]|uniref:hypothetical protein n=1 Tax=Ruania suaedae TaxID=2897774 RepID=UPI001E2BF37B|nr:hypothetical protein [Ruania suaedae]UFU02833.1 hypothetical protein LQF12_15315 [Ruania suaedae]
MADPILSAKRATLESFLADYDPASTPAFASASTGQTVLFGALANKDPGARAAIANRLLDDGADPAVVSRTGVSLLHVLLGQRAHDPALEGPLLRRLLEGGAPINAVESRDGAALAMLLRLSSLSDEDRLPMYEAFFARPDLDLDARASQAHTIRELIEQAAENRPIPHRLMREHEARQGA